jgi:hypothetical protein
MATTTAAAHIARLGDEVLELGCRSGHRLVCPLSVSLQRSGHTSDADADAPTAHADDQESRPPKPSRGQDSVRHGGRDTRRSSDGRIALHGARLTPRARYVA